MPRSKEYDSSDESSEEEVLPKRKQQKRKHEEAEEKPVKKTKKDSEASSSDSSEEEAKPKKKQQKKQKKNSDENEDVWELGNNRQIRISEFKGKLYVDIREMYYDKEENLKPGRKGIALNVEQWQKFLRVIEDVNDALKAKG